MDAQLKAQCTATIYRATLSGRDSAGDPAYISIFGPEKMSVRVEKVTKKINSTGAGGGMVTERTYTRIISEESIALTDRIWLPGADERVDNESDQPYEVKKFYTELGLVDYYEVHV